MTDNPTRQLLLLTTLPVLLSAALSIFQSVDFPAPLGPTMTTPMRCLSCSFSSNAFFSYMEMEKQKNIISGLTDKHWLNKASQHVSSQQSVYLANTNMS